MTKTQESTSIITQREQLVLALDKFIQQIYWAEDLRGNQSKKNIEKGLVEMIFQGHHFSNGILVTEDGYFLTAKHCLKYGTRNMQIRTHKGNYYPVHDIGVSLPNDNEDIILLKAEIPERCIPLKYKIYNTNQLDKISVAMLSRENGKLIRKYGFIEHCWNHQPREQDNGENIIYHNQFALILKSYPGCSGSPIVSSEGRLVGLLSGGNKDTMTSGGVKIIKALELIAVYKSRFTV